MIHGAEWVHWCKWVWPEVCEGVRRKERLIDRALFFAP